MARVQPNTPAGGDAPTRAAVRAAQQRKRLLILLGVILALVVALAVVLGVFLLRGAAAEPEAQPNAASECLPSGLRITADPAVAGALEEIVAEMPGTGGECPEVTVHEEASAATAATLAAGSEPDFDVWVPDSAMWPAQVTGQAERAGVDTAELVVGDALASTPVVFAATEPTAAALQASGAGFASLAGRTVAAVLPDPATVASSSAALLALQTAVGGDARAFTALVLGLDTGVVPTTAEALAAASAAPTPTIAVTTEQQVLEYAGDAAVPLVPVYPTDVKPAVTLPLVALGDASDDTVEAVEALSAAVASGGEQLAEYGLRDAAGTAPDATTGAEGAGAEAEPVDGTNQAEALRTWYVLTAPSRMLSLNDVSGSMFQPATADMRRIDLFEQAAVRAVNSLSADSSLATWVFSSRRIGGQDWQEIVPFGPLGDPAHKQRTIDTANGLDSLVGGGTGLYDSVLAAVQYMRDTYVPGQVHLVLLNTDGYNEDDEGLDLPGLLAQLEALRDPSKPIAVIAIGYGPDTDQAALEQIAAATDGAAYQALQPTDIGTVLIDAVTQRGCRPNCG
ncbi:VWA domain-containing protein [Microbacterium sp. M3]|uniref:VWA domain-containing protein n=1 Tax=Microbacterium arthrosphaerae TaxID=792652 RepID=A0ABU4GWH5_9MICO|nr:MULTISPECIES: VWA domain-containing protein [Microbacterium]MDW4571419.1 VWA domain-containing protein [Microbacterium arthrosphaerae]MDW7605274.1 VWA domain-containing protein [Microbacterium sp. M3]